MRPGHAVYRGRFEGNATGVSRGYNFGFSAFLNGQFLGSGQGRAVIDPSGRLVLVNATFTFPDHVVKEENVVTVVVDNIGLEQDWSSDDAFKVGHLTSYGISLTEKIGSPRDSWVQTHWGRG
ncbi:hypothetical protein AG1IA_10285 [Rhizoctonia solani AG-1 IA]|uniref:Beta-galactosidase jelly roll domain-containing protein n=1 Tax=Thanatephorus cucumeris (strain AG1-IA) TaxID=983506 RepID=L8WCK9_THACA|nr:hypothetical protein AG1IA_10285 [Rhizoctonia solani AG-1 IA]